MMLPRVRSVLFLAGLLSLGSTPLAAQYGDSYDIRPGDKITVEVFTAAGERVSVVEGERTVDRNGDVYLPYVGTTHVAELDEAALRSVLVSGYAAFYADPVVNVKVLLRVNVTGAVRSPGQYFLDPTTTVFDAINAAGSANIEYAVTSLQIPSDQRHVQLVRDGDRQILNLMPDEATAETLALRIQSGDWVHVPAEDRTALREEILFWGSLVSFASGVVTLIVLLGR